MRNELKRKIMLRIYFEYGKNLFRRNFQYIAAATSALMFVTSVSVFDILKNLPKNDLKALLNFVKVAFRDAEIITVMIFGATLIFLIASSIKATKDWHLLRFKKLAAVN